MRVFRGLFITGLISFIACSSIPKKASLLANSPSQSHIFFGGSFDPPTQSHLRLITRIMHNEGFQDATMIVAMPYKKEAELNGTNLELVRLAMKDMPEILQFEEIPIGEFHITDRGCAEWVELTSEIYTLCPSDLEYKENIFEDTSQTMRRLNEIYPQGSKNLFWIAGTDVLNSITTWPNWRELFDRMHWILVPRGEATATSFDFSSKFPADFMSNYSKSSDGKSVHFKNIDSTKPDIFITDISSLQGSSSEARLLIREKKGEGLENLLTSGVIKRIFEKGYYKQIHKKK